MRPVQAIYPLLAVICMLSIAGCIGKPAAPNTVYYDARDYETDSVRAVRRLPVVLRVNRFSVSPPFNTQRIVYATKDLHRNSYPYHQWIAVPGDLLSYLLARDLEYFNGFAAVMPPDASQSATHEVYGWVEEFIENDTHNPWQASVRIHITLASALDPDPGRRIVMQKRYHQTADCKAKTPAALAEAMSNAVAAIYREAVKDIHAGLEAVSQK